MRKSISIAFVIAITIFMSHLNVFTVYSLTPCEEATNLLTPCLRYLWAPPEAKPSPECCSGLDKVNKGVKTYDDRHDMCICLSSEAAITSADQYKFDNLPKLCNVALFAPVGPKFDCSTIKV
ncbi:Non-specific lipid-transfer protein 9 [Arabidopsis thaliana]|uniref:Non-specific lipid-transfer protein 9 n=4 Tax=Arabidopsis TaxID=3701 RepID=NLTP9_ARATH|nr:Bifunctional inhibitor/lipid-transfer protein/seed storage 2S albumin superfamily protein [Arabidopsis thaliana]Q6AWW0.1 RecName: Full=Non-specific lipid-transfer protein 9; Short=LTP 9; Flags: Precursor [Arabidopsis thaliana]AAT85734.1 At2g15325 [Arabidopsis thaliana]AEC06388.1 Bifunctional inhibitor/lipid-transfer protein/seed storage 2S albumin superfamily protein [Arabidopsis thaliana]KAG7636260.1 Bifunctional inhibitor/plant lipid transfer protein/seed storage helical domain [Arabidopsi|eukprot:NP_179135.2 Bifunctional inhibitor/lipid-transfer protein/seed storage 2S albumin superfamily protein [Arabidopsis thaliana]